MTEYHKDASRAALKTLLARYDAIPKAERARVSESEVIHQFLDPLLRDVLGWPIADTRRFRYELKTGAGRPDMVLFPESEKTGPIYLEAKRFGVIDELQEARRVVRGVLEPAQLALPGMAVDRTREEQQAINYAFENGGHWAILTNFERLRLFNARRDWLVLSFERPEAMLSDFDLLWELAYPRILDGSLEDLSHQRLTADVDTAYLDFINFWRERLAQNIIARLDRNPWALRPDGSIDVHALRDVVQRFLDRLVIVRFAEDHLVIPPGTLYRMYELRRDNIYAFQLDQQIQHLFRRFDETHNSALFRLGTVDRASFSDALLNELVEKLYQARYRAMSADILGNTYEQYLGKALAVDGRTVSTYDNLETRKKQGSYYTPQVIVQYLVDQTLGRYLYGTEDGRPDGPPIPGQTRKTAADIRDLRVLDAACGSGSFLIYAYYVLADFYERERARLEAERRARAEQFARDGLSEIDILERNAPLRAQMDALDDYPRLILERHLYGVDLDPQAAEIAVVNLMMRAMEKQGRRKRLPLILNQNVKVGSSLVGLLADDPALAAHRADIAELRRLRLLLTDPAHDADHDRLLDQVEQLRARLCAALDAPFAAYFHDLNRARPFHWGVEFPEVFFDETGAPLPAPGFTIVIGNPPWEVVKPEIREFYARFDPLIESRYDRAQVDAKIAALNAERPYLAAEYAALEQAIADLSAYVRRSGAYTRQSGGGDMATHKMFVERAYRLLRDGGRLGYVVPSGLYTDLGTKPLRELLLNEMSLEKLIGLTNGTVGAKTASAYFPGIHRSFKIAIFTAVKSDTTSKFATMFRIDPRTVPSPDAFQSTTADLTNWITMSREMIARFSPDSLSVMEFKSQRDYDVTAKIYGDHPLLGTPVPDRWNVKLTRELDMTNDRHLFNRQGRGLPLYEGKMIHQYDAYFKAPEYWVEEAPAAARLANRTGTAYQRPRLAFRDIARSTDERTLIAAVLPPGSFANNKTPLAQIRDSADDERVTLYICALFNSFVLDYIIRQKISTTLNFFYVASLPVPRLTAGDPRFAALVARAARLVCTTAAFAPLWQAVTGQPWTPTDGVRDPDQRAALKDAIDGIVARHVYGLTRDEFAHILTAFPLALPDEAARARLLAAYDAAGTPLAEGTDDRARSH